MKTDSPEQFRHGPKWLRKHGSALILGFTISTVVFAILAGIMQTQRGDHPAKLWNILHDVFRFTTFQHDLNEGTYSTNWMAICAGISMGATTALIALAVLCRFIRSMRLRRMKQHVVVCGLGNYLGYPIAKAYVQAATANKHPVVAIEIDPDDPQRAHAIEQLRDMGAIVLRGNAVDPATLKNARIGHAKRVFAVTDNDMANLEIAQLARGFAASVRDHGGKAGQPLFIHAHVQDTNVADALATRFATNAATPENAVRNTKISIFNLNHYLAQQLIRSLYDNIDRKLVCEKKRAVHIMLVGFDAFGQTIARELAMQLHFPNHKRLRVTICDENIAEKREAFLARHPAFCPPPGTISLEKNSWPGKSPADSWKSSLPIEHVCNADFLDIKGDIDSPASVAALNARLNLAEVVTFVIVCQEEDRLNLKTAVRIEERFREIENAENKKRQEKAKKENLPDPDFLPLVPPIIIMLPEGSSSAKSLGNLMAGRPTQQNPQQPATLIPGKLNPLDQAMNWFHAERDGDKEHPFSIIDTDTDEFAQNVSTNYNIANNVETPTPWDELSETMKQSNYRRALSVRNMMCCFGKTPAEALKKTDGANAPLFDLSTTELEVMAEIEHNRWMAERLMNNWRFAPNRDNALRHHDLIIPYEDLTPKQKQKDRSLRKDIEDYLQRLLKQAAQKMEK